MTTFFEQYQQNPRILQSRVLVPKFFVKARSRIFKQVSISKVAVSIRAGANIRLTRWWPRALSQRGRQNGPKIQLCHSGSDEHTPSTSI